MLDMQSFSKQSNSKLAIFEEVFPAIAVLVSHPVGIVGVMVRVWLLIAKKNFLGVMYIN